jgi:hypothetical protein
MCITLITVTCSSVSILVFLVRPDHDKNYQLCFII